MRLSGEHEREFSTFVAAHGGALLRTACLLAGSRERGQDLLQVVLLKVAVRWPRLRDGSPAAYARRVLVTTAVDQRRRRRWREQSSDALPEPGREDDTARVDDRDELLRALRLLPPRQRAVLVLRHYLDLSEADTATELGMSVGTVKSTSSRAAAALRAALPDREELP